MSKQEESFVSAGLAIKNTEQSQMFGKPCFKIYGKAFCCFFGNSMVFKLGGDDHAEAMKLKGSKLFDPSGKGRAMKEWVQVSFEHHDKWKKLAKVAAAYVFS